MAACPDRGGAAAHRRYLGVHEQAGEGAIRSHVNLAAFDTVAWEQSAAYTLDHYPAVQAFVKNEGLAFTVPYLHDGARHDYLPDFVARLAGEEARYLIAEAKGFDRQSLAEIKAQAARRWWAAVNATGRLGRWDYVPVYKIADLIKHLDGLTVP